MNAGILFFGGSQLRKKRGHVWGQPGELVEICDIGSFDSPLRFRV